MKNVSCKNYPRCSGHILVKADVFLGQAKCRSCGLVADYYTITAKGTDKIKLLIEQGVIVLQDK